ncbi:hypothetical protein Tco_0518957 [Tanacetum coccineum]
MGCDENSIFLIQEVWSWFHDVAFHPLEFSKIDLSRNLEFTVYVVPTGKDNVIVSAGRSKVIPAGRTILVLIEVHKSSTQHTSVNEVFILNISEEYVEPQPNSPLQEIIILDPDDQPMWESAKTVAPTPNSIIVRPDVDDNFVINSTHLKMIQENKFDGYLREIRMTTSVNSSATYESTQEILDGTTRGIFLYKSPNQAFQFLEDKVLFKLNCSTKSQTEHNQRSIAFTDGSNNDNSRLMEKLEALTIKINSQFQSLKEEMHEMRTNYNNRGGDHDSKSDDTPMCERHELNRIQFEGYLNQNSHDSYSHQSHHDPNDSEKSLS